MKKICRIILALVVVVTLFGCKDINQNILPENTDSPNKQVVIGDDVIYGETFDLHSLFESEIRAEGIEEENLVDMVYFSVCPSSIESVHQVNDIMGYLNPIEMNKRIEQACDAESLIFDSEKELTKDGNVNELIRLNIKYYYIVPKEKAESVKDILEAYEVIDEFAMPTEEFIEETPLKSERWPWTKYSVYGKISYEIDGVTLPAYGIEIQRLNGSTRQTDTEGNFNFGSIAKCCLVWLWINYNNEACSLSNIAGLTATNLITVDFPNNLGNYNYTVSSNYTASKLTICNELLTRYKYEKENHQNAYIPKVSVWTTPLLDGTCSAPCLNILCDNRLPDIFISGCKEFNEKNINTIQHEYTHFIHFIYANDKNDFWEKIVLSEFHSTLNAIQSDINYFLKNFTTKQSIYDFTNKYVCFAENLAEWYSYVGKANSAYGKKTRKDSGNQYNYTSDNEIRGLELGIKTYENTKVFKKLMETEICTRIYNNNKINLLTPVKLMQLVEKYDIITFQELYDALVKEYPSYKKEIQNCFSQANYTSYGNNIVF